MKPEKVFDFSYYKTLGFDKIKSWSQEDLSQFLVWDFFHAYENAIMGKDILEKYIAQSQKIVSGRRSTFFIDFIDDSLVQFFALFKKNKKKILFQNSNYNSIIKEVKTSYAVGFINQSKKDRLPMKKDFIGHIDTDLLEMHVLRYLQERNPRHLRELLASVHKQLARIRPDYIVLASDLSPIERAIVLVAKQLGILTLEIQHGLYPDTFKVPREGIMPAEPLVNGKAADYILVWGNYTKNLYLKGRLRDPQDIYVLGYPYPSITYGNSPNKSKTICYIGQGYETYNKDLLAVKLETIKRLSQVCEKTGFDFLYRSRPWGEDVDMIKKALPGVKFTEPGEKLEQTFERSDIIVGFSSTALVQAAMGGKMALQLMNFPIELDNFEELGACEKSFETLDQLEEYLVGFSKNGSSSKFVFNNDYIETRYVLGQRFVGLMREIDSKS